jgi:hypothetical protein
MGKIASAESALAHMIEYMGERAMEWNAPYLEVFATIPGSEYTFRRLATAKGLEQIDDYLAEVRYALLFLGLGFKVQVEPLGSKGPDLAIDRDGKDAVVEITRFRKVKPGPQSLDPCDPASLLKVYGNPSRDVAKTIQKIVLKFKQVQGTPGIIAIWNDDGDLEESEVMVGVRKLRGLAESDDLDLPEGLLFVLLGSRWLRTSYPFQLFCFPMRNINNSAHRAWIQDIQKCIVSHTIHKILTQSNAT